MESLNAITNYFHRSLSYLWSNPTEQSNISVIRITNNSGFQLIFHGAYGKHGVFTFNPTSLIIGGTCTFTMEPDTNRRWPLLSTTLPADLCKPAENGAEGIVQYFVQNGPRNLLRLDVSCNDSTKNICKMVSDPTGAFTFKYDVDELTINRQIPLRG